MGAGARAAFAGKTALVTGGASGIGRALGAGLAGAGARVVLADIDGDLAARAAREIASSVAGSGSAGGDGAPVTGRALDVRDEAAFRSLVDDVAERSGGLDLLFNNAGVALGGPTHELTAAHWDRLIDVNIRGVVNGVLAAYPRMVDQGHGHIVNTASAAGLAPPAFVTAYASTKHAVVGLSLGLRPEAALHGVRVSALCPGAVETPILDQLPDADLPALPTAPVTARQYLAVVGQKPVAVDRFAPQALRQVTRNRAVIVVPANARVFWYLQRLSPRLVDRISLALARRVDRRLIRPRA